MGDPCEYVLSKIIYSKKINSLKNDVKLQMQR